MFKPSVVWSYTGYETAAVFENCSICVQSVP